MDDPYEIGKTTGTIACNANEEVTIKHDLDAYNRHGRQAFVDGVIDGVGEAGRQIRGVRVNPGVFEDFGIAFEDSNSGHYRDTVFVVAELSLHGTPIEIVVAKKDNFWLNFK